MNTLTAHCLWEDEMANKRTYTPALTWRG